MNVNAPTLQTRLPVSDYDLASTLACGQAFRWRATELGWEGVIGQRWVRLRAGEGVGPGRTGFRPVPLPHRPAGQAGSLSYSKGPIDILAETMTSPADWRWLVDYLQAELNLASILATFPDDEPMRASVAACSGLRLLRQEPWECLASFILSSTKQIVQIQQIVELLCVRFGSPLATPAGARLTHAFPTAAQLAATSEADLRACKMGFRAPNLLAAACAVDSGGLNLSAVGQGTVVEAREQLMKLPGVGPKIANCVLLFAYGQQQAFPVDVWVMKALRQLYFPKRQPRPERLQRFVDTYFGPNAGYAQQYLFHYMRTRKQFFAARPEQPRAIR